MARVILETPGTTLLTIHLKIVHQPQTVPPPLGPVSCLTTLEEGFSSTGGQEGSRNPTYDTVYHQLTLFEPRLHLSPEFHNRAHSLFSLTKDQVGPRNSKEDTAHHSQNPLKPLSKLQHLSEKDSPSQ